MRLAEIYTYPVKGGYRRVQPEATVEPWGLAGDRRWLVTDPEGRFLSQRQDPAMALVRPTADDDGLLLRAPGHPDLRVPVPTGRAERDVTVWQSTLAAVPAGPAADGWLARVLGRPARLSYGDDPTRRPIPPPFARPGDAVSFADSCPVTVANAASLGELNAWLAAAGHPPVPMTRFRPNLVVEGAPAWAEDDWVGRELVVGSAVFRAVKPAGRCLVIDTDQETGVRRGGVLKTLAGRRTRDQKILFAVHLIPTGPGHVAGGDAVTVR